MKCKVACGLKENWTNQVAAYQWQTTLVATGIKRGHCVFSNSTSLLLSCVWLDGDDINFHLAGFTSRVIQQSTTAHGSLAFGWSRRSSVDNSSVWSHRISVDLDQLFIRPYAAGGVLIKSGKRSWNKRNWQCQIPGNKRSSQEKKHVKYEMAAWYELEKQKVFNLKGFFKDERWRMAEITGCHYFSKLHLFKCL